MEKNSSAHLNTGFWGLCVCVLITTATKPASLYYAILQAYPCTPPPPLFPHFLLSIFHQDLRDQTFPL